MQTASIFVAVQIMASKNFLEAANPFHFNVSVKKSQVRPLPESPKAVAFTILIARCYVAKLR
jgi:hypothetical protein